MPRFVPVTDVEKPRNEQGDDPEFKKHRKFDEMSQAIPSTGVHRGWQQGSLGWGVLGSFGGGGKDDGAQVLKKAEGQHKMVKNSKGLWVKQQSADDVAPTSGRGRGGGIPVFPSGSSLNTSSKDDRFEDKDNSGDRYRSEKDSDRYEDVTERERHRSSRDDERYRDRSRDRDHDRSRDDKRRDRSRDIERERDNRGRYDDDRDRDRRRRNDDNRSRYDDDRNRDRSRNNVDVRRDSRPRDNNNEHSRGDRDRRSSSKEQQQQKVENEEEEEEEGEDQVFQFTAVQVVNRFHEVYSTETLFHEDRLKSIEELFVNDSYICSMKNGSVYLSGREKIKDSFSKTSAAATTISKRIYVESSKQGISFCFDLHRAGTAPGLGDKTKDTALLYRSENALLTHIWGTTDSEKLSQNTELTKESLLTSKIWNTAKQLIIKDITNFNDKADAHFHNYDHMEVWG